MDKVFKLRLISLSLWLGVLICIDVVAAPRLFSIVHDFFNAGELAIDLFQRVNIIEIVLGIVIISTGWKSKTYRYFALLILPFISFFYLIPEMQEITLKWKASETSSFFMPPMPVDLQQKHQSLHQVMITVEAIKIILLFIFIFFEKESLCKN